MPMAPEDGGIEQRLQELEERYRALFNSIDQAFCVIEIAFDEHDVAVDYRFLEISPSFERQTGIQNGAGRWMREIAPDHDEHWFKLYGEVVRTGQSIRVEGESTPLQRWWSAYAFRVGEPAQRRVGVLFSDITDRKRAEADREQLLAQEQSARAAAEAANRAKDEFLSMLSHELRTPLTTILGFTELLLREDDVEPGRRRRSLEMIDRSARLQARLVDDLLDVSRIVSGKLDMEKQPISLVAVLRSAVEAARPLADEQGVVLTGTLPDGSGEVHGDADRLEQVFDNLLTNAIKFTPAGGAAHLELARDDGHAEIQISDTGAGIPAAFIPYLFDRFSQADSTIARTHGGMGLGLSIVKHFVESHGGTVTAESAGPGRGARFTVRLPLIASAAQEGTPPHLPPAASASASESLRGVRALVVEDDPGSQLFFRLALEDAGAAVTVAGSSAEALAAIEVARPDVVLTDIGMPGEDGYALRARIQGYEERSGSAVPVIAITGYASVQDRRRALDAGFVRHLSKPIDLDALVAAVAEAVAARAE
jgi:signal transduction histidine kinase/ActR/RegA family two-component response regulator